LAGTKVKSFSAHFAAGTQISDRSSAAVSDVVLTVRLKIRRRADDAFGWLRVTVENQFQLMSARFEH
jgi:hypothetical protein